MGLSYTYLAVKTIVGQKSQTMKSIKFQPITAAKFWSLMADLCCHWLKD